MCKKKAWTKLSRIVREVRIDTTFDRKSCMKENRPYCWGVKTSLMSLWQTRHSYIIKNTVKSDFSLFLIQKLTSTSISESLSGNSSIGADISSNTLRKSGSTRIWSNDAFWCVRRNNFVHPPISTANLFKTTKNIYFPSGFNFHRILSNISSVNLLKICIKFCFACCKTLELIWNVF